MRHMAFFYDNQEEDVEFTIGNLWHDERVFYWSVDPIHFVHTIIEKGGRIIDSADGKIYTLPAFARYIDYYKQSYRDTGKVKNNED